MTTVHILFEGQTPCNAVNGTPDTWPVDNAWTHIEEWGHIIAGIRDIRCGQCAEAFRREEKGQKELWLATTCPHGMVNSNDCGICAGEQ